MLSASWAWQNLTDAAQADLLEALRAIWSASSTLKSHAATCWLHEASEGVSLPYAVIQGVTTEVMGTTGETEIDHATVQILIGATGGKLARDAAKAFREAYHKASLALGGVEMHCVVDRVHGPMRDPERGVGGSKAWFCVVELDILHNRL